MVSENLTSTSELSDDEQEDDDSLAASSEEADIVEPPPQPEQLTTSASRKYVLGLALVLFIFGCVIWGSGRIIRKDYFCLPSVISLTPVQPILKTVDSRAGLTLLLEQVGISSDGLSTVV